MLDGRLRLQPCEGCKGPQVDQIAICEGGKGPEVDCDGFKGP